MEVSFCQLTTTANHDAGQFAPRKKTLSSILYILFLENKYYYTLLGEIRALERTRTYTRERERFFKPSEKIISQRKIFDLWFCHTNIND